MPQVDSLCLTSPVASGLRFIIAFFCALTISTAAAEGAKAPLSDELRPRPVLTPDEVVAIQLDALRHNDDADRGIAVAFRFASPSNKKNTGPEPRFARMIKEGPYALMLAYTRVAYEPAQIEGDSARLKVTLVGDTRAVSFVFYLTRQRDGEYADCWMTDAVTIEPVAGTTA